MRALLTASAVAGLLAGAGPVSAQTERAPTEETYICELAGECGDAAKAPESTGNAARPARRSSETRGFRLARPTDTAPAAAAPARSASPAAAPAARRANPARPASAAAAPAPSADSVGRRRANLFLTFRLGSDELTSAGIQQASVFARAIQRPALADRRFAIVGHTDTTGNAADNLVLSQRRAESVRRYLTGQGIDPARLEVRGVGSQDLLPGRPSTDPVNRRVEAEVIP